MATYSDARSGFAGMLVGLAVGAALGVLYAPKAGYQTRAQIRSKADESLEDLKNSVAEAQEEVSRRTLEARESLMSLARNTKDKAGSEVEELRMKLDDLTGKEAQIAALEGRIAQLEKSSKKTRK